jgi:hypothetical protein
MVSRALEYVGMKDGVHMIGKMMTLDTSSFQMFVNAPKSNFYNRLIVLTVGIAYGLMGIISNDSFVSSFESGLLRNGVVPLTFILFGLLSVWLTKLGLTLLLWAGARGFGGPGNIGQLNRTASIALIPGILAIPALTGLSSGWFIIIPLIIGVIWMYVICVKIHEVTQGFARWKAYASVFAVFVFFASIFYMVMPTGSLT